jgi:hypothetical protein
MQVDLSDDEKAALLRELDRIIQDDRFPLSPRIVMLKAILNKIRPEPAREPLPPIPTLRAAEQGQVSATARLRVFTSRFPRG